MADVVPVNQAVTVVSVGDPPASASVPIWLPTGPRPLAKNTSQSTVAALAENAPTTQVVAASPDLTYIYWIAGGVGSLLFIGAMMRALK